MVTLPSSSLFSSSAPLSLSPSIGWKTTAAFGMALPLVDRTTVTLMVAVAGGGVYLRPLCWAALGSERPANNSTPLKATLDSRRINCSPMAGSIDDFQIIYALVIFERVPLTFRLSRLDKEPTGGYLSS